MTEIVVLEKTQNAVNMDELSEEEREIIFETFSEQVPEVNDKYFKMFSEMYSKYIENARLQIRPELEELLLRKIVEIAHAIHSDQIYPFSVSNVDTTRNMVVPIVEDFVIEETQILKRARYIGAGRSAYDSSFTRPDINIKLLNTRDYVTGGVFPKRALSRRQLSIAARPEILTGRRGIRVRFESPIQVETLNGVRFIISDKEEINIIGLRVNNICGSRGEKYTNTINGLIRTGNYYPRVLVNDCSDLFGVTNTNFSQFINFNESGSYEALPIVFNKLLHYYNFSKTSLAFSPIELKMPGLLSIYNTPSRPPILHDPPEQQKTELLRLFEDILRRDISPNELHFVLGMANLLDLYYSALVKGKDNKDVRNRINFLRNIAENKETLLLIKKNSITDSYKVSLIKTYIDRIFGAQFLESFEYKLKSNPQLRGDNVLDLLSKKDSQVIRDEILLRKKHYDAMLTNKCPHVKLYLKFRNINSDEKKKIAYDSLRGFFADKNINDSNPREQIKCNNCGFDIICPHLVKLTDMTFAKARYDDIKAVLTKYIDGNPIHDNYHCKICREIIANVELYGNVMSDDEARIYSSISDELRSTMWSEISGITRYLNIGTMINSSRLISTVITGIYDYIFEIEKQLLKSKTNSIDDINNKKRLFIIIYGYAYFVNLIISHKSNGADDVFDFKDISKGAKPADYLKYAIINILKTKNALIRSISGLTQDFILERMKEAYRVVSSRGRQLIQMNETEESQMLIYLDPIYHYISLVNNIDSGKLRNPYLPETVEYMLGMTIQNISKTNAFEKSRVPEFGAKWKIGKFTEFAKIDISNMPMRLSVNELTNIRTGLVAESFRSLYARSKIDGVFYDGFDIASKYAKYFSEQKTLLNGDSMYRKIIHLRALNNPYKMEVKHSRNFKQTHIPLGRIFDENGIEHVFNIMVIEVDGKTIDITQKDIASTINSGKPTYGKIIDNRCSICGILFSESANLNEKKILHHIQTKQIIENFFKFYEFRCPEDGIHTITAEFCTKCKKGKLRDGEYLNNYFDKYNIDKNEGTSSSIATIIPSENYDDEKSLASWKFDYGKILQATSTLKININAFMAIGAHDGIQYEELLAAKVKPQPPDTHESYRIYGVLTYIQQLYVDYNNLRHAYKKLRPDPLFITLLENSGIKKHEYDTLPNILPRVQLDIFAKLKYFKSHKSPLDSLEFCLETFANMLMHIYEINQPRSKKLRIDFVTGFIKRVIKKEELKTPHGQVNWNLFRNVIELEEKKDAEESKDPNFAMNEEEQEDDEIERDDDSGDTNKVMANNFDIDLDPDQDPDDFENDIGTEDTGISGID